MADDFRFKCFEEDCFKDCEYMVKTHRRTDPLLSGPEYGACSGHLDSLLRIVARTFREDMELSGVSVLRA